MEKKAILEAAAFVFGAAVLIGAAWFWTLQIGDVLELLSLAG